MSPAPAGLVRLDAQPIWDALDTLREEGIEAGYHPKDQRASVWVRLLGGPISNRWEGRLRMMRQNGWISQGHWDEFWALYGAVEPLEPRPRHTRARVPLIRSEPLRPFYGGDEEMISVFMADEICIHKIGHHPALVYGEEWWDAA